MTTKQYNRLQWETDWYFEHGPANEINPEIHPELFAAMYGEWQADIERAEMILGRKKCKDNIAVDLYAKLRSHRELYNTVEPMP